MKVNTGYTSFADEKGQMLPGPTAMLITAHELGHSWGALHDQAGDECTPSDAKDGQYLMFPQAASGYSPNNYVGSPINYSTYLVRDFCCC
ncbi:unnamed protein product [Dibothriocephalus latus]|uniref:Peptidase M12B domain-containing protein n=1 Tax=Dibothriocephalus latus TaxID=60516 RepID=A0A3P7NVF5_DIBLA|nr:unnamed protein product [Dibothriocephalus latus]